MGQYEEAIKVLKGVIEKWPDHTRAYVGLAEAYTLNGRDDDARKEAAEVLRIDPTYSVERDLSNVPMKDQAGRGRMKETLRKAGLK